MKLFFLAITLECFLEKKRKKKGERGKKFGENAEPFCTMGPIQSRSKRQIKFLLLAFAEQSTENPTQVFNETLPTKMQSAKISGRTF